MVVISRPLGPNEHYFRCRYENQFYANFASMATYSRPFTDLLLIFRALRKSLLDYHIFTCNIFKDEALGDHVMRPIKRATLADYIEFEEAPIDLFSENKLRHLCRTRFFSFNEEKPLLRMFFSGKELAVTFEHTLFDGVVSLLFQEIFLENLGAGEASMQAYEERYGRMPQKVTMDSVVFDAEQDRKYLRNSLVPPCEVIMENPELDYSDNNPEHYLKKAPPGYPELWPGRFPTRKDVSVAFKAFKIPPRPLKAILARCKENQVTLTSYINVVQALAFNPVYGDKHHTLSHVAITLRRHATPERVPEPYQAILQKPGYRIVGNYAHMGVARLFAPVKEFSWLLVREVNQELMQSVQNRKILSTAKAYHDAADVLGINTPLFECALGKNRSGSVKISNLGVANFPEYASATGAPWTVEDFVWAQDVAPGAADVVIDFALNRKGGLNVVVSYFDDLFDDLDFDNFDQFPESLRRLMYQCAGVAEDE